MVQHFPLVSNWAAVHTQVFFWVSWGASRGDNQMLASGPSTLRNSACFYGSLPLSWDSVLDSFSLSEQEYTCSGKF